MASERVIEENLIFGAVCNSISVGGMIKFDSFKVDMNDGLMEILLIKSPRNLLDLNSIARSILANDLDTKDIAFVHTTQLSEYEGKEWLKLYIPSRSAVVLRMEEKQNGKTKKTTRKQ